MGYNVVVDFKAKLKDVPEDPGVYMMLDSAGEIIYVGKAKRLRARLKQYFYRSGNKTAKVMAMLEHVADFRYIICPSEVDALVTENNLIKKHTPKYNILLKDDKSYPFLRIDMKEDFPTVRLVRRLKNDGAQYFGPYMQSVNVRDKALPSLPQFSSGEVFGALRRGDIIGGLQRGDPPRHILFEGQRQGDRTHPL